MGKDARYNRFTFIYFVTHLLDSPLFAMYCMFQFILTKDLAATALQITIYVSVKPLTALFSSYWNEVLKFRSIERNLSWLVVVACLPPLLFPFVHSVWFNILGFVIYFFADRAAVSGWMELLKTRIPAEVRGWTISKCSLMMFIAGAVVPVLIAPWMDRGPLNWRWLFFGFAVISLLRLVLFVPICRMLPTEKKRASSKLSLAAPWVRSFGILRKRPDFAFFQLIFMFGGAGLIMMHAVFPKFVSHLLQLSYTDLALAFALAKAVGYASSARLWSWVIKKIDMYLFCGIVAAFAALCLFLIPLAVYYLPMLYFAFFLYGVMQGGSHLGWQLSGPIFSGKERSTSYTGVNVMSIGVRGCFAPSLGSSLGLMVGIVPTILIGGASCMIGACMGWIGHRIWGTRMVVEQPVST